MDSDPAQDPALFVNGYQDATKNKCFCDFFAYYFKKIHLNQSLKIKSDKEVAKQ
jgi:hypothetical protein